jgi:NADPH:quinone reductase-like Zn-dependent oxidoreductase
MSQQSSLTQSAHSVRPVLTAYRRERLVVPAAGLFGLPEADPQQLAMLGINPPTASLLLDEASDLKPDEKMIAKHTVSHIC